MEVTSTGVSGQLWGIAGSPGVVEGVARVVLGRSQFSEVEAGDILVCTMTNPAWIVLYTKVVGVVTDVGGPVSHPAVDSRMFGIPAVVGTSVATREIKSGDRIRVDGDTGLVEILERAPAGRRPARRNRSRPAARPRRDLVAGRTDRADLAARPATIRLIVVDDHPVVGFGLVGELANEPDMKVVASSLTVEDAIGLIETEKPDVVVADVVFENRPRGLELVDRFGWRPDGPAILLFSNYAPASTVTLALEHGAAGYLTKEASPAELARAIRTVASGAVFVSREILASAHLAPARPSARELQIITGIAGGATNKEVGAALRISPRTVETHLERCFARYDVASRAELVALAMREHWLTETRWAGRPGQPVQTEPDRGP